MALTLGRTLSRKSNVEHGSSDSGPGPELFLHQACSRTTAAYPLGFSGSVSRGGLRALLSPVAMPACPSLIVALSGGGDSFLFRPSRIPFLNVARRWSPLASASGSVALS